MAAERRRLMGELAAWHAGAILSRLPFAAAPPDPQADNPYREQTPDTPAAARLKRWAKRRRWRGFMASVSRGKWSP